MEFLSRYGKALYLVGNYIMTMAVCLFVVVPVLYKIMGGPPRNNLLVFIGFTIGWITGQILWELFLSRKR